MNTHLSRAWVAWLKLSPTQKWLIAANGGYILLLIAFLFIWQIDALKYVLMVAGVVLAAMIPELASKDHPFHRLALLCVPAIAIALVQIINDRENYAKQMELSRRLEAGQLNKMRDEILDAEKKAQEQIVLDPYDTIVAVRHVDAGFSAKADILALHVAAARLQLIAAIPSKADQVPSGSESAETRLNNYRSLKAALGDPGLVELIGNIISTMETENAYRHAAKSFSHQIAPRLSDFIKRREKDRDFKEMREEIWGFFNEFSSVLAQNNVAGVNNFLGSLARAAGREELALSYFYRGYESDRHHLPIYESLAYSMWATNLDAGSAIKYASEGLSECAKLREKLRSEVEATAHEQDARGLDFVKLSPAWIDYIESMTRRLKFQYAYFSTLVIQNKQTALAYARELYNSNKADGEYQDALGFVLMRFGGPKELDEAEELFRTAIERQKAERLTPRLAERHLQELQDLRKALRGEKRNLPSASP